MTWKSDYITINQLHEKIFQNIYFITKLEHFIGLAINRFFFFFLRLMYILCEK